MFQSIKDSARGVLHICLIPVMAALKAVEAGVGYLVAELGKV